jgi:hypothetical protein
MGTDHTITNGEGPRGAGRRPARRARRGGADAAAVATLLASGAVIGWPVLGGGYSTYLDNPAHLAEVYAAAFEAYNGWSEIAFCGFPLGTLHSPLWYGALSLVAKLGLAAGPAYAGCIWLGFVAPALALYWVARRSLRVVPSAILAYLLLVQRPAIVGIGSAFGGMWTFYLAAAALVLLVGRLARPDETRGDAAWIAALVGFILVTHLYAAIPLALLALIHVWTVLGARRVPRSRLVRQAAAGALGVLSSAVYWAPLAAARDSMVIVPQNLGASMLAARLVIPTQVLDLVNGQLPAFGPRLMVEAVPMAALLAAGGAGVAFMKHRRDEAPLYGAMMAAVLLSMLLFLTTEFNVTVLGPGSWRMLYFVRVGLALSAIPLAVKLVRGRRPVRGWAALTMGAGLAGAAVAAAGWFGAPLRAVTPDPRGREVAEVEALWRWLGANHTGRWGRVYLQDTFEKPRSDVKLSQSHILALSAWRTGVRQVGGTYGVAPYKTALWTSSEFGMLYRRYVRDEEDLEVLSDWMWASNATHIVSSDARTTRVLEASERFERLYRGGRFEVFRALGVEDEWASALSAGVDVSPVRFQTGRWALQVLAATPGDVLVKSSYHPAWRCSGSFRCGIQADETGLMRLPDLPVGKSEIFLTFRPMRWPGVLSALSWVVIAAGLILASRRP